MLAQEVIRHKRDGQSLTKEEIEFFINGIIDWSISECQIASFVMAVCLRGLNNDEIENLTRSMANFGNVLSWDSELLGGPIIDKLSSGGIGDKATLILAPVLAACGAFIPMISAKSTGYTGGIIDKLSSIPGYNPTPSFDLLYETVVKAGCAIIAQSSDLSPATKRILAVQDDTATLDCLELKAAAVLARKIATGAQSFIFDIKCDDGKFLRTLDSSRTLGQIILNTAVAMNLPTCVAITDMTQNIGTTIGNALEIKEALDFLKGIQREERLEKLVKILATESLLLSGLAKTKEEAFAKIDYALNSGQACERFALMLTNLGAPADFVENPEAYLPKAKIIRPVYALNEGYVQEMEIEKLADIMVSLGGLKETSSQRIDYAVGLSNLLQVGEQATRNKPLALIHADSEQDFEEAQNTLLEAVTISQNLPKQKDILYEIMTADFITQ